MTFIILDRDGVINYDSDEYIKSSEEWIAIPGSLEAIAQLNRSGFRVLVATNQSGIGRGFFDMSTLDQIHEKLTDELAAVGGYMDEIFFCPHHPNDGCFCRKPKPGLIHQMQQKYALRLPHTFFIGDSSSDVEAARAGGCQPILVLTGKGQQSVTQYPDVPHFLNLAAAVESILEISKQL